MPNCPKCGRKHDCKLLVGTNGCLCCGRVATRVLGGDFMLKVFLIDVYAILDLGSTISFVKPYVEITFYILPKVLLESFSVSTPLGDFFVAKWVYRRFYVSLSIELLLFS